MDRLPYSRTQLNQYLQCTRQDISTLPFDEMMRICAAAHAYGVDTLTRQRIHDLLEKAGDNYRSGRKLSKYLSLAIAAAVGVVVSNNLAILLTLNMPFLMQGLAAPIVGALIGAGSERAAATLISDLDLMLYRMRKELSLRSALVEAKNEFRVSFLEGQLEQLDTVENHFLQPQWLVGGAILLFLESLAGFWLGWQATEDVLQAISVSLAPVAFIIVLASISCQLLIIPEKKGNLLNNYRHYQNRWIFRDDDPTPHLIALPFPKTTSPIDAEEEG